MKLSDGKKGCAYTVHQIDLPITVKRRLQMLGMTDGTKIIILNRKKNGPMIINIRGTRFALGKGFCSGITIEEAGV